MQKTPAEFRVVQIRLVRIPVEGALDSGEVFRHFPEPLSFLTVLSAHRFRDSSPGLMMLLFPVQNQLREEPPELLPAIRTKEQPRTLTVPPTEHPPPEPVLSASVLPIPEPGLLRNRE